MFATIFFFAVMQFFIICYGKREEVFDEWSFHKRFQSEGMLYAAYFNYAKIDEIIKFIKQDCLSKKGIKNCWIGISFQTLFTELISFQILNEDLAINIKKIYETFVLQESADRKLKLTFRPQSFDYLITTEPLERYVDKMLIVEKNNKVRFKIMLELISLRIRERLKISGIDKKLSNEDIKNLLQTFLLEVQQNAYHFQLVQEINPPQAIFKERYYRNCYLYKRITP
jgi:hypothetical protein